MSQASTQDTDKGVAHHAETGIVGIDAIVYSTDGSAANWQAAQKFFNDWGLKELSASSDELCFETLSGARSLVRH